MRAAPASHAAYFLLTLWYKQIDSCHLRPLEPGKHQNKSFGGLYDLFFWIELVPVSLPLTRATRQTSTLNTVCV